MKHLFVPTLFTLLTMVLLFGASSCDAGTKVNPGKAGGMSAEETSNTGVARTGEPDTGIARADLPHSQGRVFYNLDDYLAHLVVMGHQDRPFYVKLGTDRYKLNSGRGSRGGRGKPGRGGKAAKTYTRADLMAKFGFSK